jgi:RNA 3'-terminal phosphate cyclase (ATP)
MLRTALALSAASGEPFEMRCIRDREARSGLLPEHVAVIRATAFACSATVNGAFDGSPDLRFQPGPVSAGRFRFELATGGAASLLVQTVLLPLATAEGESEIAVTGATHLPGSPPFHYLSSHWSRLVRRLGLRIRYELVRAGFHRRASGELRARVEPWPRPASLQLDRRGDLVSVSGISGTGRSREPIAERLRDAAQKRLWEAKRLDVPWELPDYPSASPGSFVHLEALFEHSRAAWCLLGEPDERPEALGDRAARHLLAFLESDAAVDAAAADQLAVPMALARGGGMLTTPSVTAALERAAEIIRRFGVEAKVSGRMGGPGSLEVGRC